MFALLGEHFLPPALTEALHELGGHTDPLAWAYIEPILRENLGDRMGELDIEVPALLEDQLKVTR